MKIQHFFDKQTATFCYIVIDEKTNKCAIIDSVLGFDIFSGKVSTKFADQLISYISENNLRVEWILETHVHADHLTASSYLKKKIGGKIAIGEKITEVIKFWAPIFNIEDDSSKFDYLFKDNEIFSIGNLEVKAIETPGHTPACITYLIEDCAFVGDTIFMPQLGTARTDFPGASAETLYNSIQKLLSLPNETRILVGHDYPKEGEELKFSCTVLEQKEHNILVNKNISQDEYVKNRNKRDEGKEVPKLLLPALQVNLQAGNFSKAEENDVQYIKIPINKI